jgi:nuclear protein localization protein 4 homolog
MITIRVRTRDGTERLSIDCSKTLKELALEISQKPWGCEIDSFQLSFDERSILSKASNRRDESKIELLSKEDWERSLSMLGMRSGTIVYMSYECERMSTRTSERAKDGQQRFGQRMSIGEMIKKQVRVGMQDRALVKSVSFCGPAANMFQAYVNATLGFKQSRFGWLYGTKTRREEKKVLTEKEEEERKKMIQMNRGMTAAAAAKAISTKKETEGDEVEIVCELFADVIYEPKQSGNAYVSVFDEEDEESKTADALATAMGYEKIGCVFNQSDCDRGTESVSAMSAHEVTLCAKLQAKYGKEFVTVIVMQFADEDEELQVTFEAFQVSEQCVKLYNEGFFELDETTGVAKLPQQQQQKDQNTSTTTTTTTTTTTANKNGQQEEFSNWGSHTKMTKPVMVERKDVFEVDNDFWIVAVPIKDHSGTSQSGFPIENRIHPQQTIDDLRSAIRSRSGSTYAEKLRDFHLLLFLCKQMDKNDVMAIAQSTNDYVDGGDVADGYKVLIDAIAGL